MVVGQFEKSINYILTISRYVSGMKDINQNAKSIVDKVTKKAPPDPRTVGKNKKSKLGKKDLSCKDD